MAPNLEMLAIGAGERIRTSDLLITNQLLYRLSYTGGAFEIIGANPGQSQRLKLSQKFEMWCLCTPGADSDHLTPMAPKHTFPQPRSRKRERGAIVFCGDPHNCRESHACQDQCKRETGAIASRPPARACGVKRVPGPAPAERDREAISLKGQGRGY